MARPSCPGGRFLERFWRLRGGGGGWWQVGGLLGREGFVRWLSLTESAGGLLVVVDGRL